MKFIQLNICRGFLKMYAIDFLKKENADIINLQEVSGGMGTTNTDYFDTKESLQKALGYRYSFYSPTIEGRFGKHFVSEGQLMLSRYPITYKKSVYMHGKPDFRSSFVGKRDRNVEVLQHARIKAGDKTINLLNYHGFLIWGSRAGNKTTEAYSKVILEHMDAASRDEYVILSGDFNLSPASKSLRMISGRYPDLISRYKIKTTRNELSREKTPVDNIFVNDRVRVKSFRVPRVYISDHLPLVMSFE
jgi:endonuclease/exonuclease/phosphatase family metal-dependent hydrolase